MKFLAAILLFAAPFRAQTPPAVAADPFATLAFLQGTWDAKTPGGNAMSSGAASSGTYTFRLELGNHILARHSRTAGCKGPAGFDCDHGDLLYIYQDAPGQPLKAIYFDNEGHTLHYTVSTPEPGVAIFLSDVAQPGPQFRLMYTLKGAILSGKFGMRMPGQADWRSYLEWSGAKLP